MWLRHICNTLLRRTRPVVYAAGLLYADFKSPEKPKVEEKLNLESPNTENLSFDYMIKQSAVDAVNSATQALTIAYAAITATSNEYRALLTELITLLSETLTYNVPDSHWDKIIQMRVEVNNKKETVNQLVNYMDYVHKMAEAASEICFLSGMDDLSSTLYQRLEDAVNNMKKEVERNKELENAYSNVQHKCIQSTKESV